VLATAGIGFGVWRPRFSDPPKPPATPDRKTDAADAEVLDNAPAR
jgi:hypothetical protein